MQVRYAQSAPICPILADPLLVISFAAKEDAFTALGGDSLENNVSSKPHA
jgi:hypothetical protein